MEDVINAPVTSKWGAPGGTVMDSPQVNRDLENGHKVKSTVVKLKLQGTEANTFGASSAIITISFPEAIQSGGDNGGDTQLQGRYTSTRWFLQLIDWKATCLLLPACKGA